MNCPRALKPRTLGRPAGRSPDDLGDLLPQPALDVRRPEDLRTIDHERERREEYGLDDRDADVLDPFPDAYVDGEVVWLSGDKYRERPVRIDEPPRTPAFWAWMTFPMGAFIDWVLYPSVLSCCSICCESWSRSLFFPWKLRLIHAAVSLGMVDALFPDDILYRGFRFADLLKEGVFSARLCNFLGWAPNAASDPSRAVSATRRHPTESPVALHRRRIGSLRPGRIGEKEQVLDQLDGFRYHRPVTRVDDLDGTVELLLPDLLDIITASGAEDVRGSSPSRSSLTASRGRPRTSWATA